MSLKKLSVIFAGTPDFAVPALNEISTSGYDIKLVLTQPDRKSGRGMKTKKSPIKQKSNELGIPVIQPNSLKNNKEVFDKLTSIKADILVVVAYGLMIPNEILDLYDGHAYNIHASILPRWRGAAPIHRAIEAGDKETGITIMKIAQKLDAGPMAMKKKVIIEPGDTTKSLSNKLSNCGGRMMVNLLKKIESGNTIEFEEQNEKEVTYAEKIKKIESSINFFDNPELLCRKIRAFNPYPMINMKFGEKILKIINAEIYQKEINLNLKLGELFLFNEDLLLKLNSGFLKINEVRLEGKRTMKSSDFVKGNQILKNKLK